MGITQQIKYSIYTRGTVSIYFKNKNNDFFRVLFIFYQFHNVENQVKKRLVYIISLFESYKATPIVCVCVCVI
jgi:hypothetical protein